MWVYIDYTHNKQQQKKIISVQVINLDHEMEAPITVATTGGVATNVVGIHPDSPSKEKRPPGILKPSHGAAGAHPVGIGKNVIALLEKLNRIAANRVRLRAKLHHVFNPNSQSSVALSGTAWVTIEFGYSYFTMIVCVCVCVCNG